MTFKPNFDVDLRHGKAREDALAHLLLRSHVEVKSDRKCRETGNIAVEFEQVCRDGVTRKSGIAASEAHWYAVEFDTDCWIVLPTEHLKAIARAAIRAGRHKWIGDADEHHNALVPVAWLVNPPSLMEVAA